MNSPCETYRHLALRAWTERLSPADQAELDRHRASCAACRAFESLQRGLDRALDQRLSAKGLSPGFAERLRRRVAQDADTDAQHRDEQRRQAQSEWEQARTRLRRRLMWRWQDLLPEALGAGVVVVALALALPRWSARYLPAGGVHWHGVDLTPGAVAGCLLAAGVLVGVVGWMRQRPVPRLLR